MLRKLKQVLGVSDLTCRFPAVDEPLDTGLLGVPRLVFEKCQGCARCVSACPSQALRLTAAPVGRLLQLSLADCLHCGRCQSACPEALSEDRTYHLAARRRADITQSALLPSTEELPPHPHRGARLPPVVEQAPEIAPRAFRGGLRVFVAGAGSCGGCEAEIDAAFAPPYELARLGVERVSAPSQADAFLLTGPVTRGAYDDLRAAYDAAASPKLVVALGACASDGGVFRGAYGALGGVHRLLPVDLHVPGCAPTPRAILSALLVAMDRRAPAQRKEQYTAPSLPAEALAQALAALSPGRTAPPPPPRQTYQPPPPETPAEAPTVVSEPKPTSTNAPPPAAPETPVMLAPAPAPEAAPTTAPEAPAPEAPSVEAQLAALAGPSTEAPDPSYISAEIPMMEFSSNKTSPGFKLPALSAMGEEPTPKSDPESSGER